MKAEEVNSWIVPAAKLGAVAVGAFAIYKLLQKIGLVKTAEEETTQADTEEASQSAATANVNPESEANRNAMLSFNPQYRSALVIAYAKKYGKDKTKSQLAAWLKLQQMPSDTASIFAKQIYDSKGTFNDNEDTLYNIFRNIKTQYQLSFISGIFSTVYKKDLLEYLKSFLNDVEINKLLTMVKNYPQYQK
jgi:hypothetical protein